MFQVLPPYPLNTDAHTQVKPSNVLLGLRWQGLADSMIAALYLTYTLFAGVVMFYIHSFKGFAQYKHLYPGNWQLLHWRNYVIAPVTEEFAFRACMAPMLRLAVRHGHMPYVCA